MADCRELWKDVRVRTQYHELSARNPHSGLLVATLHDTNSLHNDGTIPKALFLDLLPLASHDDYTYGGGFGRWAYQARFEDKKSSRCPTAGSDVQFQMAMGTAECRTSTTCKKSGLLSNYPSTGWYSNAFTNRGENAIPISHWPDALYHWHWEILEWSGTNLWSRYDLVSTPYASGTTQQFIAEPGQMVLHADDPHWR